MKAKLVWRWKSVFIVILTGSFFILFVSIAESFMRGDVDGDDRIGLSEAINSLQVVSGMRSALATKTIDVPGDFQTIQEAIDAATEGDTINIAARPDNPYKEQLLITKDNLTLQGAGESATILDGEGADVITIRGAKTITIKSLTVQNGYSGIFAKTASIELTNVTVRNCAYFGIYALENSTALFSDITAQGNSTFGILIVHGSTATFSGAVVSNDNHGVGIGVRHDSGALFVDASVTAKGNSGGGIWFMNVSSGDSMRSSFTLKDNNTDGLGVFGGSDFAILPLEPYGSWLIENNKGFGIHCNGNSGLVFRYLDPSSKIHQNGYSGVDISSNSFGSIFLPSGIEISGNSWEGVRAEDNSSLYLNGGKVIGNAMSGVVVDTGSTANISGVTITGNTGGDVVLRFGARATLNGNTIGTLPITCDGTVLSRGDVVCPP